MKMLGAMCVMAGLQAGMMSTAGGPSLGARSIPDLVQVEMSTEAEPLQLKRFSLGESSLDDNAYAAVAMLLRDENITRETSSQIKFRTRMAKDMPASIAVDGGSNSKSGNLDRVCPGSISDVSLVGNCSGVLIAPSLVLTAGHCFAYRHSDDKRGFCDSTSVAFGVTEDTGGLFDKEKIYKCKSVLFSLFAPIGRIPPNLDIAVFMLDRPVVGIKPAVIESFDENFHRKDLMGSFDVRIMQYPLGMPLSVAEGFALLTDPNKPKQTSAIKRNFPFDHSRIFYYVPSTFGSSGSPIFNAETGGVVGVVNTALQGHTPFKWNKNLNCYKYFDEVSRDTRLSPDTGTTAYFAKQLMDVVGIVDWTNLRDLDIHNLRQTSDATEVQAKLIELGYLEGKPDGKWGEKSARALWKFKADFDGFNKDKADAYWQELQEHGYKEGEAPIEEFDLMMELALFPRGSSNTSTDVSASNATNTLNNKTIIHLMEQRWKDIYSWQ